MKKPQASLLSRSANSQEREEKKIGRNSKGRTHDYSRAFANLLQNRAIPRKPLATIQMPVSLNLDADFEEVLRIVERIRGDLIHGDNGGLNIDLSNLCDISTEAALLILAEIDRSMSFRGRKITRGNYPSDPKSRAILSEIGYFAYFKVREPPVEKSSRVLLRSNFGHGADGSAADALVKVFEHLITFSPNARGKLYAGLTECMTNVQHHAYRHKRLKNCIKGRWWMNGYADPATGEITFSFVDQGISIPTSLRENWKDWLTYNRMDDSALIIEAVKKNISRLHNPRRGNGLPELYEILTYAPFGKFRIMSNQAIVTLYKGGVEKTVLTKTKFRGTMISWSLFPNEPSLPERANDNFED